MSSTWRQVAGLDPTRPNVARVYDYWLGGSHHFVADRELGQRMETLDPWIRALARANRSFLGRAVRFLAAECGIRQFLDIGSGIPATGNVHEVSQQVAPGSRVVYVDHDPVAVALSHDLLASNDGADIIHADLRQPEEILSHPAVLKLINFSEPTAVLFVSVLHFLTDADDPYRIVARFQEAVVPGSCLVMSHGTNEDNPHLVAAARDVYAARAADGQARSREEITALFGGWGLLEPGLVHVPLWRPDGPQNVPDHPERFWMLAGVAHKPEQST